MCRLVIAAWGNMPMRFVLACCVMVAFSVVASAKSGRIQSFRVLHVGTFVEAKALKEQKDANISTGQRFEGDLRPDRPGSSFRIVPNLIFGVLYDVQGGPKGATVTVQVKWQYPQPGVFGRMSDEYDTTATIGGNAQNWFWRFQDNTDALPAGTWSLQILDGSRVLASHTFELTR